MVTKNKQGGGGQDGRDGVGRWVEVKRDLGLWMLGCRTDI